MTLTQGHGCDIDKQKFACLQGKVKTTQPITAKLSSGHDNHLIRFLRKSVGNDYFAKFSSKILDVFFQGQTLSDISQE